VKLEIFGLGDKPRLGPPSRPCTSQPHPESIAGLLNLAPRGLGMFFGLGGNPRLEPQIHPRTPRPRPDLIAGPLNPGLGWSGVDYILFLFVDVDTKQIDL
jgi:hypothetical protein